MVKKVIFSTLFMSQMVFAGSIDRIETFKIEKLNKLDKVLSAVANRELSGNCGGVAKLKYDDRNLAYAAVIASVSGEYTEEVEASPSSFDKVQEVFEELVSEREKEAKDTNNKQSLKIIAEARKELATLDLLADVNVYVGGSSGAFSSSHAHFVVLDYTNKEVFSFSDGYCE